MSNDSAKAKKLIAEAQQQRTAEMAYHQKLVDYVNWFEVTKNYSANSSSFDSYFSAAREMEHVQASDPNPIRADLLKVESQL